MFCQSDAGNILWRDDKEQALSWTPLYPKNAALAANKTCLLLLAILVPTKTPKITWSRIAKNAASNIVLVKHLSLNP